MVVRRGAEPPKGRKNFKQFVEIGNVKLRNFHHFKECMNFLRGFGKNIRIIENSLRPGARKGKNSPEIWKIVVEKRCYFRRLYFKQQFFQK